MATREELARAVQYARARLESSSISHLEIEPRSRLWAALGPTAYDSGYRARMETGPFRRATLCVLATERVLPIWDRLIEAESTPLFREEDSPHEVLRVARDRMHKRISWDEGWTTATRLGTLLQYAYEVPEHLVRGALVANAAIATLGAALKDLPPHQQEVLDVECDAWDAPFYACWASCGAPPWGEQNEDRIRARRDFWSWFIDDAFSVASVVAAPR